MTSKSGKEYDAIFQVDADKKGTGMRFPLPAIFNKVELDPQVRSTLNARVPQYITGMEDKNRGKFNAYVYYNPKEEKFKYSKTHPERSQTVDARPKETQANAKKESIQQNNSQQKRHGRKI